MMNLKKDAMSCYSSLTAESEFLKAMDAKRQGDEPSPRQEMAELERLTEMLAKQLSPEYAGRLRELSAGWRELVLTGYALSLAYVPHTADGVGELLTAAPEGADWRGENLRLTRAAEALAAAVPESLPLGDRWDDLAALALLLGQRR